MSSVTRRPVPGGNPESAYVGLDVGGTSIRSLTMSGGGQVLRRNSVRVGSLSYEPARLAEAILQEVRAGFLVAKNSGYVPESFCAGVPFVTDDSFTVRFASNVDSSLDLGGLVRRAMCEFSCRATARNDVRCATEGELWCGALQGVRDAVVVNIGTGLSAGIVVNGDLVTGAHNTAGEIAYLVTSLGEPGARDDRTPLEDRISGRALRLAAERFPGLAPECHDPVEQLLHLCRMGDPVARAIVNRAVDALALALTNLSIALDPEVLLLTGGIASAFELIEPRITEALARLTLISPKLVVSKLGSEAALLGAILYAARAQ